MSSPTPISDEEAETLKGLLVGSDKYKSRPGILPELFTYQPSPLRISPPNRPSVPEEASGSNSVKSESAFAGTLIVFNAWNSASFIKLLTRLSSDIGTL